MKQNKIFTKLFSSITVIVFLVFLGNVEVFAKSVKIGVTLSTQNNPWFVAMKEVLMSYSKDDLEVIVLDAQNDSAKELANVEDLLSKKVDIVLINCIESLSCVSAVREAHSKKIPVVTIDRNAQTDLVASYVAADNRLGAKEVAKYLVKILDNKGTVAQIEGTPGSTPAIERGEGFAEGLKGSNLKIVTSVSGDFMRSKGMSVMEDILQSHPNISAVWTQNDEMGAGAIQALKGAGKLNQVKVVSFDGQPHMIKSILAGEAYASALQDPAIIAKYSIETALSILEGKEVAKKISVPTVLVTKENVEKYK